MGNFQNLRVWQLAKELAVEMYKVTSKSSLSKDYGLKDQILRSAVSISANIAEGDELGTNRQSIRHFYIAKGSSAELQTLLIIAKEINYIEIELEENLVNKCKIISVMLSKIITVRNN
jgi:four helix bundle protein